MLHSIFHSVDHMLVEVSPDGAVEGMRMDECMDEEILDGDDTIMKQEISADDDTIENTDSTNIPLTTRFCCEDCGKTFATNKYLRRHIRKIHNRVPEPCAPSLSLALQKKSSVGRACCSDCGVWFSANKNLLRHIRTSTTHKQRVEQKMKGAAIPLMTDSPNGVPDESRIVSIVENNVVEHSPIEEDFSVKGISVTNVSMVDERVTIPTNNDIQELKMVEHDIEDITLEEFKIEQADENVESLNGDGISTKSEIISSSNDNVEGVSSQEQVGLQQKRYPCEECGQQFTKKSNVYRHMRRIHHIYVDLQKPKETLVIPVVQEITNVNQISSKRFACDKCDQTYTKKCNLQRHVRNAHSKPGVLSCDFVKSIKCEYCVQLFARRSSLLRHMRRKHLAKYSATIAASKTKLKFSNPTSTTSDLDQFLLVDKNLRLSDYPFLKNMLPASYDYNLKFYSAIIEKTIPYKCFTATIQFHCPTVSETKYWVTLFERTNKLSFKCVNVHAPSENDESFSRLQYKCTEEGCPAMLSIATNGAASVQNRNLLRVTVRIVHKHTHKWDPPRLDLSQLVEAVIEEQDLIEESENQPAFGTGGEQINLVPEPAYYAATSTTQDGQQPVMTLYFNKFGNSYVTQNVSLLTNGTSNPLSGLVLLDENKLIKTEEPAGVYDAIGQFKRVCGDMTVMIQQDPQYFANAVRQFEESFDRICNSKFDLLTALGEFGKSVGEIKDGRIET